MSEAKFTKGEWKVIESGDAFVDDGLLVTVTSQSKDKPNLYFEHEIIIAGTSDGYKEAVANAHLIAAAPDMYSLLERLTDHSNCKKDIVHLLGEADNLLAKARGES